jgi:F-type H+-transporting ATPase subunit delta
MSTGSVARRYARAMMTIGAETSTYEKLGREVRSLAGAMRSSEELTTTLSNPAIPRSDRRRVLEAVAVRVGASKTTIHFAFLLLDRERIGALPDVSRELDAMIDDKAGRARAEVVSAEPLTPAQEGQLKKVLEQVSGRSVQMQKREDPELLGGVVAKVGDLLYDGSLRSQLERMRQTLTK